MSNDKNEGCGESVCHGHGDYAICGKPYYTGTYICKSCIAKNQLDAARASLTAAEQLLAARDKRIAALERRIDLDAKIMNNILVGNQAAWIEWQRGAGAEEAMIWVQNTLMGVGIPDEDQPFAKEPQAWYSANKSDPFPTCFCGRPSHILWMGQGFCSDAHHDEARAKVASEAFGKTGMPIFDGSLPDTEGGSCD